MNITNKNKMSCFRFEAAFFYIIFKPHVCHSERNDRFCINLSQKISEFLPLRYC